MPYIPESHKEYNVLPRCKDCNCEFFLWDHELLTKIKKKTGMLDYMINPYRNYESYEAFLDEMDNWIKKYPDCKNEIIEYRESVMKMNNKDLWAIVQYLGESNFDFTNGNYYYVPMYYEGDELIIGGIIDNEEYSAFASWLLTCTNPVDLINDLKIVIDPSGLLKEEFIKRMNSR